MDVGAEAATAVQAPATALSQHQDGSHHGPPAPGRPPRHKRAAPRPPQPVTEDHPIMAADLPEATVAASAHHVGRPTSSDLDSASDQQLAKSLDGRVSRASLASTGSSGFHETTATERSDGRSSEERRLSASSYEAAERRPWQETVTSATDDVTGHPWLAAARPANRRRAPAPPPPKSATGVGHDREGDRLPAVGLNASSGPKRTVALPSTGVSSGAEWPASVTSSGPAQPVIRPAARHRHKPQTGPPRQPPLPPDSFCAVPPPPGFEDDDLDIDTALFARKRRAPPPPLTQPPRQKLESKSEPMLGPELELESAPPPELEPELEPGTKTEQEPELEPEPVAILPPLADFPPSPPAAPSPAPRLSLSGHLDSADTITSAADRQAALASGWSSVGSSSEAAPADWSGAAGMTDQVETESRDSSDRDHSSAGDAWKDSEELSEMESHSIEDDASVACPITSPRQDLQGSVHSDPFNPLEEPDSESIDSYSEPPKLTSNPVSSRYRGQVASPQSERRSHAASPESAQRSIMPSPKPAHQKLSAVLTSSTRDSPSSPGRQQRTRTDSDTSLSADSQTRESDCYEESETELQDLTNSVGPKLLDIYSETGSSVTNQHPSSVNTAHPAVHTRMLEGSARERDSTNQEDLVTSSDSGKGSVKNSIHHTSISMKSTATNSQTASLTVFVRESREVEQLSSAEPEKADPKSHQTTKDRSAKKSRWTPPKVQLGSWTGYSPGHRIQLMDDEDYIVRTAPMGQPRQPASVRPDSRTDFRSAENDESTRSSRAPDRSSSTRRVEQDSSQSPERSSAHSTERVFGHRDRKSSASKELRKDRSDEEGSNETDERNYVFSAMQASAHSLRTSSDRSSSRSEKRSPIQPAERTLGREATGNYVLSAGKASERSAERKSNRASERSTASQDYRESLHHFGGVILRSPERNSDQLTRKNVSPPTADHVIHTQNGDVAASRLRCPSGGGPEDVPGVVGVMDPSRPSREVAVTAGDARLHSERLAAEGTGSGRWQTAEPRPVRPPAHFGRTARPGPLGWKAVLPVVKGFRAVPSATGEMEPAAGSETEQDH